MPRISPYRHLLCATLLAALLATPTQAADDKKRSAIQPGSCPIEPTEALATPPTAFSEDDARDGRVHIASDEADAQLGENLVFRGHVELLRNNLRLFADEVNYNQRRNSANARGNLLFQREGGELLRAPAMNYEFDTDRATGDEITFNIQEPKARGAAKRFFLDGRNVFTLDSVRFTTCPQGRDDWYLRASKLTLDKSSETGTARHAVFEFSLFGLPAVPIFYTPYLSFPLTDERRSGFLSPHIGDTTKAGFFIAAPYYINLAPNYDLTLTPRFMSQRGIQWGADFRYLDRGQDDRLILEYLPNDQATGNDRQKLVFKHNQQLSPYWSTNADIEWVSDNNYFIDLGSIAGVSDASQTHLPRSLRFDYGGNIWRFMARISNLQTIDSSIALADTPYQRLPQLVLSADVPDGPNRLHYSFYTEWVNFYRAGQTGSPTPPPSWTYSPYGQRLDVYPSVSLPLRTTYFYLTPRVGYRYTSWSLQHFEQGESIGTTVIPLPDATPERSLPIYSVDSGLVFERDSAWGNTRFTQTLEPRLFYVRIPYRNQDHLPIFDSAIPDFSFYNFFRENRFTGADRVGDAHQFTTAITSRFLGTDNGIEYARLSIGQVQYLEDQRVNWPMLTPASNSPATSDFIGEIFARLDDPWYLSSAIQWDDKNHETRKTNLYFTYRPASDRTLNFGFRYLDTPPTAVDRQFDIAGQWPLNPRWIGFARWNYSVQDERSILALVGIEYSHCCWGFRLTARHRILADGTNDNTLMFHMLLGGIATSYDRNPDSPLLQNKFMFE